MNKFLKIFLCSISGLFLICYFSFLFILPNVIKISSYKTDINTFLNKNFGINLNFEKAKVVTTPFLGIGLKVDMPKVTLKDGSELFDANKVYLTISAPRLIFKQIKTTKVVITRPSIFFDIEDDNYKVIKTFNEAQKNNTEKTEESGKDYGDFKINIPEITVTDYLVRISDLKTKDEINLTGNNLIAGYSKNKARLKTAVKLNFNGRKNISLNIDVISAIPKDLKVDPVPERDESASEFVNPVEAFKKYDLKADITAKIKLKEKNGEYLPYGNIKADKISITPSGLQLPESMFDISFSGDKAELHSDLFVAKDEHAKINLKTQKGKSLYLKLLTDKIQISNIFALAKAFADSFGIKNDFARMTEHGTVFADAEFYSDFKKVKAKGKILVSQGFLQHKDADLTISGVNIEAVAENNDVTIKNAAGYLNGISIFAKGAISSKADLNINLKTGELPVKGLFNTFAPSDLKKNYKIKTGILKVSSDITGRADKPSVTANINIKNLTGSDKKSELVFADELCNINLSTDLKTFKGIAENKNFTARMSGVKIEDKNLTLEFTPSVITVKPSEITANENIKAILAGDIKNYAQEPKINISADGYAKASDLKKIVNNSPYFCGNGTIAFKALLNGNSKEQVLTFQTNSDNSNWFSPIEIKASVGKQNIIMLKALIKDNTVTFKESGLYAKSFPTAFSSNLNENISKSKLLLTLDGEITNINKNPYIKHLEIKPVQTLDTGLCAFRNSRADVSGTISASGHLSSPIIRANILLSDVAFPTLMTTLSKSKINLAGQNLTFNLSELGLNGSLFDVSGKALLKDVVKISDLIISSDSVDADKVLKVAEAFEKVSSGNGNSSDKSQKTSSTSNLPIVITSGKVDFKKLTSGKIVLADLTGNLSLNKNVVYLKNSSMKGFEGTLAGDFSYNIPNGLTTAKLTAQNLNAEKVLSDCANMKNTIFGTMGFDADISFTGADYISQMKTLKGNAKFTVNKGQFGSFGKFENFLLADNLASVAFLSTKTGAVANAIAPYNSANFETLKGNMTFSESYANIPEITSAGQNMSLYLKGKLNLINTNADMVLSGRISEEIKSLLGPLERLNPVSLIEVPYVSTISFRLLTQQISAEELQKIPELTGNGNEALKFTVKINGNINYPQKSVKSFKWLNTAEEIQKASRVNTSDIQSVKTQINQTKENIKNIKENMDKIKDDPSIIKDKVVEKAKEQAKETGKNILKNTGKQLLEKINQNIEEKNSEPVNSD